MARLTTTSFEKRKGSKGFATTEFLFAVVIAFGMTIITFSMTYTLSVVELAQYVAFSAARAHAASNFDIASQKAEARIRFKKLVESDGLFSVLGNPDATWFIFSTPTELEIKSGNGTNFDRDYSPTNTRNSMQGVRATLEAKILESNWPLIGKIAPAEGFSAKVTGILIRESSQQECMEFMEERADKLWTFDGANRFNPFKKSADIPLPVEDNGC